MPDQLSLSKCSSRKKEVASPRCYLVQSHFKVNWKSHNLHFATAFAAILSLRGLNMKEEWSGASGRKKPRRPRWFSQNSPYPLHALTAKSCMQLKGRSRGGEKGEEF